MDYSSIITAIEALPFADLLRLNADLATLLKKEGKTGAVGKAAKKEKKEKDPDAPKRPLAAGTAAWMAFVKHCKSETPDRFEGISKESEKLAICKAIREEDKGAYEAFCKSFIAEHPELPAKKERPAAGKKAKKAAEDSDDEDSESESESEAPAPAPAPKPLSAAEKAAKLAALKKGAAGGASAASSPKPAAPAKKEEKKAKEEKPKKKEVKKAKKEEKPAEEEEPAMPKKEIAGASYWFDPETNGLWKVEEGDGFGAWVGYFQPEDEEEPIRYTDQPE